MASRAVQGRVGGTGRTSGAGPARRAGLIHHGFVHHDSGNAALELLILAPVILGLIGLVIAAGRTSVAQGSVDAAARDAASGTRTHAGGRSSGSSVRHRSLFP